MMEKCINCNTLVVKMKTEMQEILMDHVKIISRIQKFVSTTEANETTSLRAFPEMQTRQDMNTDQNEEDEVINVESEEEEIYECEKCNKTFENVHVLGKHLEMYYKKKHISNDFAVNENENNASNQNEQEEQQVSYDENILETNQHEIEGAAEEQEIDNDDNFNFDQSEIDEQEIEIIASNQNVQQESIDEHIS